MGRAGLEITFGKIVGPSDVGCCSNVNIIIIANVESMGWTYSRDSVCG